MENKIQDIIWKLEKLPASDLLTEIIVGLSELLLPQPTGDIAEAWKESLKILNSNRMILSGDCITLDLNINKLKNHILKLEETVIEGNQNAQEKNFKLQSQLDEIREVVEEYSDNKLFSAIMKSKVMTKILAILNKESK